MHSHPMLAVDTCSFSHRVVEQPHVTLRRTLIVTSFGTVAQTLKTERSSACATDYAGDASKSHASIQH